MPVQIQAGDLSDRIRRALGIRGPIPQQLDLTVSPVVNLGDIGSLPYQLDVLHGAGHQDVTGAAGIQACIAIENVGPAGSVFLVEQLCITSGAVGQRVEIARSAQIAAEAPDDTNPMTDTSSPGVITAGRSLPVSIHGWTTQDPTTVGSLCEIVSSPSLTTSASLVLPVRHLLRRGEVCYLKHLNSAQRLIVGVSGRFWPSLGDTGA